MKKSYIATATALAFILGTVLLQVAADRQDINHHSHHEYCEHSESHHDCEHSAEAAVAKPKCPNCAGKGKVDCTGSPAGFVGGNDICNNGKQETITFVNCSYCKGTGKTTITNVDCRWCKGKRGKEKKEKVKCDICDGKGKVTCNTCLGTGKA